MKADEIAQSTERRGPLSFKHGEKLNIRSINTCSNSKFTVCQHNKAFQVICLLIQQRALLKFAISLILKSNSSKKDPKNNYLINQFEQTFNMFQLIRATTATTVQQSDGAVKCPRGLAGLRINSAQSYAFRLKRPLPT